MIKNFLDFEKHSVFIITAILALILIGCANTPVLLNLELENIFNSFLINDLTHNIISVNLEATSTPPLFFWMKHLFINTFGFSLAAIKIIPALFMCGIILLSYIFIVKQTGSKSYAMIASLILATSPFFITASKLISLDLVYIAIYMTTTFIFTSNVYSNNYSNLYTFVAGVLIACAFSLTGLVGALPILANFVLINFVRGGFLINLKFNNPIVLALGFAAFGVIWVVSLGKVMGYQQALELVFNYKFLDNIAVFEFDEGAILKYTTLFIIGGFPWIALLPSALYNTIALLPRRLHTSDLQTSLPLICLINAAMLSVYFATVEQEFYILLAIYFNFTLILADRIYKIEVKKISWINILFVAYSIAVMMLFLNEFLNINLFNYQFDTTVKQLLLNEHTSINAVSNNIFYLMAFSYFIGTLALFAYAVSKNRGLFTASVVTALINFTLFIFAIFPNLNNKELNNSRSIDSWLDYSISSQEPTFAFYKLKNPIIASKAEKSFYFDDAGKLKEFAIKHKDKNIYVFFNKDDRYPINRLKRNANVQCRNQVCYLKLF